MNVHGLMTSEWSLARRSKEVMSTPTANKRRHLRDFVYQKNLWDEPLSEADKANGFLEWHERGYLPHCDMPGLTQLVTCRLHDSLPASRQGEWKHLLSIEDAKERRAKLEEWLDRGYGECHLRNPQVAGIAEETLLHHHSARFELLAWCVMPNHVHLLVHVWDWPLAQILQNWKSVSAVESNKGLNRSGTFWQREYWDTFMRDQDQEARAVRYIEGNPVRARLCRTNEEWRYSSARFRDKFGSLTVARE